MKAVLLSVLSGLPYFLLFLCIALAIIGLGIFIYIKITPYKELELIRKNNISAAISLSSTILGLSLPIAFCLATSVNIYDLIIWGALSAIVQILIFLIMDRILDLSQKIGSDLIAPVILYSSCKLASSFVLSATIVG